MRHPAARPLPGGISCREARPRLALLIEKETDPLETLRTRRHVDGCEGCRSREAALARVMASVGASPDAVAHATPDFAAAVMDRLRGAKARALAGGTAELAMKWTGLLILLTAGLTAWARHGSASARLMARPLSAVAAAIGGALDEETVRTIVSHAAPLLLKAARGEPILDLMSRTGFDLALPIQIGLTAATFLFVLVLPVSGVLAWMLRDRT